jgi:DNA mismatch repair protein MutL
MINKIAAGEVIERPASVIKELVENSIDAEAKRIEALVENAGMDLIRVIDDGIGMTEDQLLPAIMPHATSKITDTDDLFKINTFGFRGEALASIAEISQFTLKSRAVGRDSGSIITCNGGERSNPKPCGMPVGTQIDVKNLFFNTPVRRKYMKTTSTEIGHIMEVFIRLSIPHPNIHFVLRHNDRTVYDLPAEPDMFSRIKLIFGDDVSKNLVYIAGQSTSNIRIDGYVSLPSGSRLNSKLQYLFLNGRFIRDRSLQHALGEAYRGILVSGRFPIAFLNITMPPEQFDVNVHPTKLEVRFLDSNRIYSGLLGAVREKFMTTDLREQVDIDTMKPATKNAIKPNNAAAGWNNITPNSNAEDPQSAVDQNVIAANRRNFTNINFPQTNGTGTTNKTPDGTILSGNTAANFHDGNLNKKISDDNIFNANSSNKFGVNSNEVVANYSDDGLSKIDGKSDGLNVTKNHNTINDVSGAGNDAPAAGGAGDYVVGAGSIRERAAYSPAGRLVVQMHNRYLVLETESGIAIIDQHALHERILYERMKELMGDIVSGGKLESQRLLVPIPIDLSPTECSVVMDNIALLKDLGLQVEAFGGDTIIILSLPAIFSNMPADEILLSLIEPLLNSGSKPDPIELLDEMLHSMACKAAIKAGEKMQAESIAKLLAQAETEINAHHCPHGRPASLIFTCEELDKRFRR